MDQLLRTGLPIGILLNAIGDLVLAIDPTGAVGEFVTTQGPFKDFVSADKLLVANTFSQSFLFHGLVRLMGSRRLNNKNARMLIVVSYVCEMYQAARLISAGAISPAQGAIFILGPLASICGLLAYPEDKKDKRE